MTAGTLRDFGDEYYAILTDDGRRIVAEEDAIVLFTSRDEAIAWLKGRAATGIVNGPMTAEQVLNTFGEDYSQVIYNPSIDILTGSKVYPLVL